MAKFGTRSESNLKGINPVLERLFREVIKETPIDFTVIDGLRTLKEQKEYVKNGYSKTLRSRHLTGKAVDVMALVNGKGTWDEQYYKTLSDYVKAVAKKMGIAIVWGGDWSSFPDPGHFELDKTVYGY